MTVRITYDGTGDLMDRIEKAYLHVIKEYDKQVKSVFTEKRLWPAGFKKTYRQSGEVVEGSFRNIYDLGNAVTSQKVRVDLSNWSASFSWDGNGITPMAVIHEGAVLENGGIIPPRPFTRVAARELDIVKTFVEGFHNGSG